MIKKENRGGRRISSKPKKIYRTILHQFANDNDWNNVYSSSALPSGSLGTIKIEAVT